ncbi:hypothetical protein pdam_00010871 [Pocillopora damicornis]|uniref:Uncharacterized protein n=1 Tax=Pocillopora damicornis TaxID=46731 RepID=A0A3M6TM98_POCDA|nr:hypothetical protein pdam_00010871 [Pocillopora damicornis]
MNGNPAFLFNTTSITRGLVPPEMEISALPQAAMNRNLTWETRTLRSGHCSPRATGHLERKFISRAAQNCFLFEKNLKKREEKLEKREENERRKKEERARKEQQARKRGEREASETRQTERRNDREEVSNPTSGGGETLEQMLMSGTSRLEK